MPSPKMFRAIYGCAKECGVSNDQLHDIVNMRFGKTSLKQLTLRECFQLMDGIRGVVRPEGSFSAGRRQAMNQHGRKGHEDATEYLVRPRELQMLHEAAALRGWTVETLTAFCQRQVGRPAPATMKDFNKIFWALKAMNRRDGLYPGVA